MNNILFSTVTTVILVLFPVALSLCRCEKPDIHDCCGDDEEQKPADCNSIFQFCSRTYGENTLDIPVLEQPGDFAAPLPAVLQLPETISFEVSAALTEINPDLPEIYEPFLPRGPPSKTS